MKVCELDQNQGSTSVNQGPVVPTKLRDVKLRNWLIASVPLSIVLTHCLRLSSALDFVPEFIARCSSDFIILAVCLGCVLPACLSNSQQREHKMFSSPSFWIAVTFGVQVHLLFINLCTSVLTWECVERGLLITCVCYYKLKVLLSRSRILRCAFSVERRVSKVFLA